MNVYLLTPEQKDLLEGRKFLKDSFFNPTEDADGNWFISIEEITAYKGSAVAWVKKLPAIEYKPIQNILPK